MRMSSPELGMPMPPPRIVQQSSPSSGYLNRPSHNKEELQFPAGLRVLVVDDDQTTLRVLEVMLRRCLYTVTTCGMATKALELLRENKNKFDLVISDVHMPDMNGFKLLELVGLEMDLPVIMMSVDGDANSVMKGVTHGACDYLMKPVRIEELRNIWQHVVRKKQHGVKEHEPLEHEKQKRRVEEADYASTSTMSKKRKDVKEEEEDLEQESEDPSSLKKQRVVWSPDLHRQFVDAVNQLGVDKAFPKKILELMDVPGLTRENVASHLQKYRLYLRKSAAMMCGTPTSGGDVRPMAAATSYSTVTGVEPAVLGTPSSSAVDSPSLLPFPVIQGGPVNRPSLTSTVFSTQPSNYFSTFTGGNQLEPVIGYGQMQPQLRPADNVAALPSMQHQAVRQRLSYGNSLGAFQVAPAASSPSMVQLLQPRQHQHQQQQQQQQQQGLNVSMAGLAQQHQQLVPGGLNLGINNSELGYGNLCMRAPSKNLVQGNSTGAVAGSLAAALPLATAPISTSAFNSALDFGTKLPVTNGYSSMVYDNNQNRTIGGGWQDLAQVTLSPRYSESVASRNFNNNNNFVADSHVNLDVDGRRESESTADSSFKPKMGIETTTRFGLENQSITAAAPDDLVSYYLKQQQEDLSYQDNGIGFDGFVLDNVCA